jgi:hypothetical protein
VGTFQGRWRVAIDQLILVGALSAWLVQHDEPVLVVAAREERRHRRGSPLPPECAGD